MIETAAAFVFSFFVVILVFFQLALALGVPWGEMAMGGKFPGRFPIAMRIGALLQLLLLVFMALVVLTRAGLILGDFFQFSISAIWFVVGVSVVSAVLNTITPSKKERILWSPVTFILVICAFVVALS